MWFQVNQKVVRVTKENRRPSLVLAPRELVRGADHVRLPFPPDDGHDLRY